jgi:hypothetical protein
MDRTRDLLAAHARAIETSRQLHVHAREVIAAGRAAIVQARDVLQRTAKSVNRFGAITERIAPDGAMLR